MERFPQLPMIGSFSGWYLECMLLCLHALPFTSSCKFGQALIPTRELDVTKILKAKQAIVSLG